MARFYDACFPFHRFFAIFLSTLTDPLPFYHLCPLCRTARPVFYPVLLDLQPPNVMGWPQQLSWSACWLHGSDAVPRYQDGTWHLRNLHHQPSALSQTSWKAFLVVCGKHWREHWAYLCYCKKCNIRIISSNLSYKEISEDCIHSCGHTKLIITDNRFL